MTKYTITKIIAGTPKSQANKYNIITSIYQVHPRRHPKNKDPIISKICTDNLLYLYAWKAS
jgi:hypothetical protein